MPSANLFERLHSGITDPAKVAMILDDGSAVTYADVVDLSGRLANVLVSLGLNPGDRIAAQAEKSVPALILYLAAVRAGGVYLPLNTGYTLSEMAYFLADAEPRVIVCDPARAGALRGIAPATTHIATLDASGVGTLTRLAAEQPARFDTVPRDEDDLAAILYTSGTTGKPKGAMMTHRNILSNALTLIEIWRFTADDVLIHALPIFHTHGLFVASNCVLFANASMRFQGQFRPDAVIDAMAGASCMMGVPTFYTRLLAHPRLTREATRGMRLFISGSAPLLADTHREWEERTGHAILERYGMTEIGMATSNPYDGPRVAGAVGLPLPGVDVRVVDTSSGVPLPPDDIGMIEVRGPNVFKGYWRLPEKTAAEFRDDDFFVTGDLGKIDARGYVHIIGRGKDLIITGGFNVYPKEVEAEIDALAGVIESAVIGVPHPDLGEGVTAIVVQEPGRKQEPDEIRSALSECLAKFKLPKKIIFVDELPRNTMGKVQKNILRESYAGIYGEAGPSPT